MEIDRTRKGPRLAPRVRADSDAPATRDGAAPLPPAAAAGAHSKAPAERTEATRAGPTPGDTDLIYPDPDPDARETAEVWPAEGRPAERWPAGPWLTDRDGTIARAARIYFATTSVGGPPAAVAPWPAEAPLIALQELPREPGAVAPGWTARSEPPHNETIAPKGEVTGEDRRPKSPAELLGLAGAARARHEKCLADAVYFEARGEPVRGQMAVAQVVINRVFSGYYPGNICGVVYQSTRRHRHLRCQFSFTCDGIPDRVTEPDAWDRARHIARDALDGSFWLNDIGKATHYHARWVHPWWVREMRRLDRIGVHTFYRPRKWGDGADSPVWGDAEATATAAKTL